MANRISRAGKKHWNYDCTFKGELRPSVKTEFLKCLILHRSCRNQLLCYTDFGEELFAPGTECLYMYLPKSAPVKKLNRPNVELLEITDLQENRRLSAEPGLKKRLPHYVCADFFSFLNLPTASMLNKINTFSNYSETRHST